MLKNVRLLFLAVWIIGVIDVGKSQKLYVGGSVNIFSRFGYLGISMRVVPRNDSEPWLFREPTLGVFRNSFEASSTIQQRKTSEVLEGDFHMEFCDNVRQLLQAYFRDFTFEKLDRPWRAFTGGWSKAAIAKHLGINASFITGDHCYVLVRVVRFRDNQRLTEPTESLILDENVAREADNLTVGDYSSVVRFIRNYGSHYIASFVTGNSLYQVFVYTPQTYLRIKKRLKTGGVAELESYDLQEYFTPWYAEHMGVMLSASGNRTVEAWARDRLRVQRYLFTYVSLMKLHGNAALLRQLDGLLGNEALLQLQLRTLAPLFKDPKRREWFLQVIDNYFKLWEVNM